MTQYLIFLLWRWAQIIIGWILIVLGPLIGGPIPGPFGFIAFGLGLMLVLRNSRWARRLFIRLQRRYPRAGGWIRRALLRRKQR